MLDLTGREVQCGDTIIYVTKNGGYSYKGTVLKHHREWRGVVGTTGRIHEYITVEVPTRRSARIPLMRKPNFVIVERVESIVQ
jgi:hypothetical protein